MARETPHESSIDSEVLPEFEAPPLFETVFGVRFPRIKGWDIRYFGHYSDWVREAYPKFEVHPPFPGPGPAAGHKGDGIAIQLSTEPEVRAWYLVPDRTRLIQIQHNAFFHNWRKVTLEEVYPRYTDTIRPSFEREWNRFQHFLSEHEMEAPDVVECEATYLNHLEQGREWSSIADLPRVLKWWSRTGPEVTRARLNATFTSGDLSVDVSLIPVVRRQDSREILQLSLMVKGRPASSGPSDVINWMDQARAAIVRGFTDVTTDEMHELWRRNR